MSAPALTALLVSALAVRGSTTCPSPTDVAEALAALVPDAAAAPASKDSGELVGDGDAVRVRLVDAGGAVLAEKRLPRGSCRQMAETAAVVLAAWVAELRPDVTLGFALPPPAPASPAPAPSPVATVSAPAAEVAKAPAWMVSAGANVLASFDGNTVAPGASVEARLAARRSAWAARLTLTIIATHRLDVAPGQAAWRRTSGAVGIVRRWASSRAFVEAAFDLLSGLLSVEGEGFTVAGSDRSLDGGASLGARAGLRWGRFEPHLGADVVTWLRPQTVEASGIQGRQQLPSAEAHLGIGLSVAWEP